MTKTLDGIFGSFLLLTALGIAIFGGSLAWILWRDERYGFVEGTNPCIENYGPGYEYGSDFQSCRPSKKVST